MKITQKLILVIGLISVIVVGASIFLSYSFTKTLVQQMITQRQLELANQVLDKIDRFLSERSNGIQIVANSHLIQDSLSTPLSEEGAASSSAERSARVRRELLELSVLSGPWDALSVVNRDGVVQSSTVAGRITQSVREESLAGQALASALRGESYHSDVALSPLFGKPTIFFAYPVRDVESADKEIIGAVIGQLSWPSVLEFLQNSKYHMDLLSADGLFLGDGDFAHFDRILKNDHQGSVYMQHAIKGEDGALVGSIENAGGVHTDSLIAYSSEKGFLNYRGNNWVLVVSTPVGEAFAGAAASAWAISALLFLVIMTGSLLILFMLLRFLRPIRELTMISNDIAAGDLSKRLHFSSRDEFGVLARSFNMMASTLQDLYRGLEEKIAEKTSELQREKAGVEQKVIERTQQLADEQTRLEASINSLSVGYILTGADNSIILINEKAKGIFLPVASALRKAEPQPGVEEVRTPIKYLQLALGNTVDIFEKIEEVKRTRTRLLVENIQIGAATLVFHITPIVSEETHEVLGTVMLVEDITERKVLERSRDEFFSIASHELRTPLTAIRGNVSILQEYFMDQFQDKEVETIISDIQCSSERLIEIVNIFLDVSRLEQGKIVFVNEEFDVVALCRDIVQEYTASGVNKELYLRVLPPFAPVALVRADRNRIRQVIINLIGNAMKFTDRGGVEISFMQLHGSVKVLVSDTGSGISLENQSLLFRKFQQAETNIYRRDATRGTGLGLYISKMLINSMGGSIFIESSEVGKGSTFGVTIPDESAAPVEKPEGYTQPA